MFNFQKLPSLLQKYDRPGPRYTSYPTVPAWNSQVESEHYRQALQTLEEGDTLSLYIHLPFCENLCHFCGCTQVITKDHSRSVAYIQSILKEMELLDGILPSHVRAVSQVHLGGGTPNFIQPNELSQLMAGIRKVFKVLPNAEIAIEMHPRTSTQAFCEKIWEEGFNRISLGVQDLDPVVQKLINRHQTYEMTEAMVKGLRQLGFHSFNLDLVYGLPGQTMKGWEQTLKQVQTLTPDRLAVYSYAHVPWIRPVQRTFQDSDLPPPKMKMEAFLKALQFFIDADYQLIGMDHFAKKEDELSRALEEGSLHRNFMGYSTRADAHQIGLGMSAISFVGGNYFQNQKDLKIYSQNMQEGFLKPLRGCILTEEDHRRKKIITQLMCRGVIDKNIFDQSFSQEKESLRVFQEDGLLDEEGCEYRVVNEGFLFLRNIAMVFDQYLGDVQKNSKTPTFSRTV